MEAAQALDIVFQPQSRQARKYQTKATQVFGSGKEAAIQRREETFSP